MKIKQYKRQYERVFTGDELIERKCDVLKIECGEFGEIPEYAYRKLWIDMHSDLQQRFYQAIVRYVWLSRKFSYRGYQKKRQKGNGTEIDRAFGVYMRHFVGYDNRLLFRGGTGAIKTYVDDFIPFLDKSDPFKQDFKYPYKYMTMEALVLVYQIPERLELLDYGEQNKMRYTEFLDYVLNYISCYNEEYGEHYHFIFSKQVPSYIKKKI